MQGVGSLNRILDYTASCVGALDVAHPLVMIAMAIIARYST